MAYSEKVLEHYEKPKNIGSMDSGSDDVGTGLVGAPECGDVMKLQIKVDDEGKITDAKFKTFGCGSAIAASSLATDWVTGKSLSEAEGISNVEIVEELSLPPVKIHCSVLAEDAIKAAINDYKSKNNMEKVMPLNTQTSAEFYTKIVKLVEDTKLSYMDAVLHYCDQNNMEPETAAQLINTKLKAQIREEAEVLNFLPKTAKLPL